MESSLIPPDGVGKSVLLTRILHAYFKHRIASICIFLVTAATVGFATFLITPRWTGVAYVNPEGGPKGQWNIYDDLYTPSPPNPVDVTVQGLIAILNSDSVSAEVVEEFGLDERLQERQEDPQARRDKIKKGIMDVVLSPIRLLQDLGVLSGEKNWTDKAVADFQKDWLQVDVVEGTQVIAVGISAESIDLARRIPNRLVEVLEKRLYEFRRSELEEQHAIVSDQITRIQSELGEKRTELQALKAEKGVLDLSEVQTTRVQQLEETRLSHALAQTEIEVLQKRLEVVEKQMEGGPGTELTATTQEANPTLQFLIEQLQSIEIERAGLVVRRTEEDVSVRALDTRIEETKQRIAAETALILKSETHSIDPTYLELVTRRSAMEADVVGARARAAGLAEIVAELESELTGMAADELSFVNLQSRIHVLESIDTELSRKKREMDSLLDSVPGGVNLRTTPAVVFDLAKPDWPKWELNVFVALVLGLVLALGWPLWAEYWRDAFVTMGEVEQVLRVPVLGFVPRLGSSAWASKRRVKVLGKRRKGTPVRRTVAALLAHGRADRGKMLLCYPDSDVDERFLPSVVGPALAAFAPERRVCMLTNREVLKAANCEFGDLGDLGALLEGDAVPGRGGLNVVHVADAVELALADPDNLERVLADLAGRFQLVLLGPIGADHPVGQMASRVADGIVWVVKSDSTRRPRALAALEKLDPRRDRSIGAILTNHRSRIPPFMGRWLHLGEVQ